MLGRYGLLSCHNESLCKIRLLRRWKSGGGALARDKVEPFLPLWIESLCLCGWMRGVSLKGDGLIQCAQKYPCWGWGPLTEELSHNFWTIFSRDINAAYLFVVVVNVWVSVWDGDRAQDLPLCFMTPGLLLYPVFSQSPSHCSPPSVHLIFLSSLPASALGLSGHII